jgi:hypothetical protein
VTRETEVPTPWVNGPEVPPDRPEPLSSDRDERRLVMAAVRLLMRLPRVARWGLLAAALGGAAEASGGLDAVLDALLSTPAPEVRPPDRAHRPDLRLERADLEALDVR